MAQSRHTDTGSRWVSKKEANRIAAAKVYVAASKKAGLSVPDSVKQLAGRAR